MTRPYSVCGPGIFKKIIEAGDEFLSRKKIKETFTESGAETIIADKFYDIFHRPIAEWRDVKITKTKLNEFKNELNLIEKGVERGQVLSATEHRLYVTDAQVRRHPTLRKLYNNFRNIDYVSKGNSIYSDESFSRLMENIKRLAIVDGAYSIYSNRDMNSVLKMANNLEAEIMAKRDAVARGDSNIGELRPLMRRQSEFLVNGEGKIFRDFSVAIEEVLPKLAKKILNTKDENGNTWLSEQKLKAANRGHKISDSLKQKIKQLLRAEGKLDGKKLRPEMVEALFEHIDLTSSMYRQAELGVDALIKSIEYGMEAKRYDIDAAKWSETKKRMKKEMLPKEIIGYYPHYGYKEDAKFMDAMMHKIDELNLRTRESLESDTFSIDKAIDDIKGVMSNRLKARQELDPQDMEAYSRNVPVVLKRYVDDINQFNKNAFITRDTRKALRDMKKMFRQGKDLSGYGQSVLKMVLSMHADQTGLKERMNPELEAFQRGILNLEFVSKLGVNIRSGFKQYNQFLAHKIELGWGADRKARKIYEENTELSNIATRLAYESGIHFAELPVELAEAGVKIPRGRVMEVSSGKYQMVRETPGPMSTFADKTGSLAGTTGIVMKASENALRTRTFRTAFAGMEAELRYSDAFAQNYIKEYKSTHGGRAPSEAQITNERYRRARNYAVNMVSVVHFDYSKLAKSNIMKQGLGRFLFQFQHFSHSFWNWNAKKLRGMKNSTKAREFTSDEAKQFYSLGLVYSLAPVFASYVTGWDVSRIIENESVEKIKQIGALITGFVFDDEEVSGPLGAFYKEGATGSEILKDKFAGRGALSTLISFPVGTDLMAAAELTGLYSLDEESAWRNVVAYRGYYDETDDSEFGNWVKLFSTQVGRTWNHTGPLLLKGSGGTAALHELGLYRTQEAKDLRKDWNAKIGSISPALEESLNNLMGLSKKKRKKKRKKGGRRDIAF